MQLLLPLVCTLLLFIGTFAQTTVTPEMRTHANSVYQQGDWQASLAAYERIVLLEETNPQARYRLANSLLNLNRPKEALPHLEKLIAQAPNPVFALSLLKTYGRLGDRAKAYQVIEASLKMGGIAPATLKSDKDLAAFQTDAAFIDLLKRSDMAANPCKAAPEFRQFDFWIGEWDVKTPQGQPAGSSSVQLILGDCTIFENWTAGAGGQGKSFNIFDKTDGKWHQSWVSDRAVFTHYVGELVDGKMVLTAKSNMGGKPSLARMTYSKLPNGDVRQFGESSADDGKTWTTSFDLIYSRKK
jgi:hypothetical protein